MNVALTPGMNSAQLPYFTVDFARFFFLPGGWFQVAWMSIKLEAENKEKTYLCWSMRSNTICDDHKVWNNRGSSSTMPKHKVFPMLGVVKAITTIKLVCRDTPRSVLATWTTWLLEDLRTAGESRYKVPAQVPMLPGTCRCPQENKEGTEASQEITLPHLSYPHCHGSPSLLSNYINYIIRLDASLN